MSFTTVENALVTQLITDSAYLHSQNMVARKPRVAIQYILQNLSELYAGYTLFGGGVKREDNPHTWTHNLIAEFLVRGVEPGNLDVGEERVRLFLDSIGILSWRMKSRLGGACLRSAVVNVGQPSIISYNGLDFYLLSITWQADEDYENRFAE